MRRLVAALLLLTSTAAPARAQLFDWVNLERVNSKLDGRVVDFTQNHGADRRICSPILQRRRDLYVYLPPGYNPSVAYPLTIFLHGAHVDEHAFLDPGVLKKLDRMMSQGEVPAAIIAAPDGTYEGYNRITSTHSLWVNGLGGRFEDHVVDEVLPFVMQTYSIRPEREAHALLGISAGGFGAMTIAMKHRKVFGAVATVAGPLNVRYGNKQGKYADDFDPATYRARTEYDPDMIIAQFYLGIVRRRAKTFFERVYGTGPQVSAQVFRDNPADLLTSTNLRPGELAIYINHPDRDNYNFDAQDQSFAWLAARRGLTVDLTQTPGAKHNLWYIQRAEPPACSWLGRHILPPARRPILAEMPVRREPEARNTSYAVPSPAPPPARDSSPINRQRVQEKSPAALPSKQDVAIPTGVTSIDGKFSTCSSGLGKIFARHAPRLADQVLVTERSWDSFRSKDGS